MLYTFTGTKINRSLGFLLTALEVPFEHNDAESSFTFSVAPALLPDLFEQLRLYTDDVDLLLTQALETDASLLDFTKWGTHLPKIYQCEILKERFYDFDGARQLLERMVGVVAVA